MIEKLPPLVLASYIWATGLIGWLLTGFSFDFHYFLPTSWEYVPSSLIGWYVIPCTAMTGFVSYMIWYAATDARKVVHDRR